MTNPSSQSAQAKPAPAPSRRSGPVTEQAARWDARCEQAILFLLLAILVFAPLATGAVRAIDFLVVQGLTALVAVCWLARVWLAPRYPLHFPPICWGVLAFTAYALVRYWLADIEYVARQEFIRVLVYCFLFFAVVNNVTRKESAQVIVFALLVLAVCVSGYAMYQWSTNSNKVWHFLRPPDYANRGSGTYICPNHLAGFLEMILPWGLAFTLAGRFGHLAKILIGYSSLVILAGIAVTMSRAGWLATVATLLALLVIKFRHRNYRLPALVLMGGVLIGGMIFLNKAHYAEKRLESIFQGSKLDTAVVRQQIWGSAWKLWQENRWWGIGPGHFDYRFRQYRPEKLQAQPDRVHNDYLNTLTDWGVAGLTMVGICVLLLYAGVFKTWKYVQRGPSELVTKSSDRVSHQSTRGAVVLGAALGLFALIIHSFFDFNMHIPANAILAVVMMALLASHLRYATEAHWVALHGISKLLVTLLAAAGVIYLIQQAIVRGREEYWLRQAETAKADPPSRLEHLKKAYAMEPNNFSTAYEIGETLRQVSWQGMDDEYQQLAEAAIKWFERASRLNRFDPYSPMRLGMCLHWIGRHQDAAPYFARALSLDPNGYYILAHHGWHLFQLEQYAEAKPWFERSRLLTPYLHPNPIADSYLAIINRRLTEPSQIQYPPRGIVP